MSFASLKKASSGGSTFAKLTREIDKLNQPAAGWFSFSISRVSLAKVLPVPDAFLRDANDIIVFSVLNV